MSWVARVRRLLEQTGAEGALPALGTGRMARLWLRSGHLRSILFLALGSAWDAATLTRIDRWSDQAFLAAYQVGLTVLIVLQLRMAHGRPVPARIERHPWMVHFAAQFLLGGLLSAFTIYYLRGAASLRAAGFVALLVALLVVNEFADRTRFMGARLALLGFCLFNGVLFAVPVWLGHLVSPTSVASVTLVALAGVLVLVRATPPARRPTEQIAAFARSLAPVAATLAGVLAMVWLQVLPPLPLSLNRVGVFHDVARVEGGYALTWEPQPIVGGLFWRYDRVFRRRPGDAVWCFSSVFVPRGMDLAVAHVWERYEDGGWARADRLALEVRGGRDEGFRTFTRKENVSPGDWRVRIVLGEEDAERELGRVVFSVEDGEPARLTTEVF